MKFFFLFETAQSKTRSMAFSLANKQAFSSRVNFAWKIEYVCNYVSKTTSSPSLLELNFLSSRCSLCHVTCSFFFLRSSTCDSGKSENAQQKKLGLIHSISIQQPLSWWPFRKSDLRFFCTCSAKKKMPAALQNSNIPKTERWTAERRCQSFNYVFVKIFFKYINYCE